MTGRPATSCSCGLPQQRVIPVGDWVISFVAKLPSVQMTLGWISWIWRIR